MALRLTVVLPTRQPMGERLPSAGGEAPEAALAELQQEGVVEEEVVVVEEAVVDNITDALIRGITALVAPSTASRRNRTASRRKSSMMVSRLCIYFNMFPAGNAAPWGNPWEGGREGRGRREEGRDEDWHVVGCPALWRMVSADPKKTLGRN